MRRTNVSWVVGDNSCLVDPCDLVAQRPSCCFELYYRSVCRPSTKHAVKLSLTTPLHPLHVEEMADEEQELYDEFGNYLGPDLDDSSDDDDDEYDAPQDEIGYGEVNAHADSMIVAPDASALNEGPIETQNAIVLHEDKEHYASAEDVYGSDVRAVVLDEDAMDLDTPIVAPMKNTDHTVVSDSSSDEMFNYADDYLAVQLSNETAHTRRGVAILGHFHHGKTSLVDLLLEPTLITPKKRTGAWGPKAALEDSGPRYLDTLKAEHQRGMSLASTPMTTLLPDSRGKVFCISMLDCPGHPQFHDESCAALKVADGAVLVVDIVEGVQLHTVMVLKQAISEGLALTLVLSKLDRCIVELKLPPTDMYFKILNVIDSLNEIVKSTSNRYPKFSPPRGNVAFSSALHGWLFTLKSFSSQILANHRDMSGVNQDDLIPRLWGDAYLDPTTRQFFKTTGKCRSLDGKPVQRTFVALILNPLYKIYSACLGEREADLNPMLRSVGIFLTNDVLRSSARPLLRAAMSQFFPPGGFVDMIAKHIPNPVLAAPGKLSRCYTGPSDDSSTVLRGMKSCDASGPTVIHCVKNFPTPDGQSFWTLGRIYSGTVRPAETVHVLGEMYGEDDEDSAVATISAVAIPRGRTQTQVSLVKAGNWVMLQGIDANMAKTATVVSSKADVSIFAPLKFPQAGGESVMKLAIEPLNPSELPKMVEGLRRVSKAYPMAGTKVEESGEHVILGTGELYMDCIMHDLRHVFSDEIEVKVADPVVSFRETVMETSSMKCFAETANKRNKLTFIAEPMDDGLAENLEAGKVRLLEWDQKKTSRYFQAKYNWDILSSRSVWAFGDSPTCGTNILLDDTLPGEIDKGLLSSCRSSIVQGFQWATREGPLCEEPVRGTKLKILDAVLAEKPIYRGGGQVIPTARRTVHSALLTASPRLMEPMYRLDIMCPGSMVESIQPVLTRRRGHIVQDRPVPGSKFSCVKGFLPVLDSFGFETDLRTFTQGQAMVYSVFDHWAMVPGDPLDRDIILHPLEPSPPHCLARELLIKTRRRKGLAEDVSESKFFDAGMKQYMAQQEQEYMEVQ